MCDVTGVASRRPDDKIANRLAGIASDMASRNENYDPALTDGESKRRVRTAVIICVAAAVLALALAGILTLLD